MSYNSDVMFMFNEIAKCSGEILMNPSEELDSEVMGYSAGEKITNSASALAAITERVTGKSARGIIDLADTVKYESGLGHTLFAYRAVRNIENILIASDLLPPPAHEVELREEIEEFQKSFNAVSNLANDLDMWANTIQDVMDNLPEKR